MSRAKTILRLGFAVLLGLATSVVSAEAGQPARDLFPGDEIRRVRISPNGEWVVATARNDDTYGIFAQRFGHAEIEMIRASREATSQLDFVGADTLIVRFEDSRGRRFLRVDFSPARNGRFRFTQTWFDPWGYLVDPLPLEDGVVLWGFFHRGRESVHRVELDDLVDSRLNLRNRRRATRFGEEVATIKGFSHGWIVDRKGVPVVAHRRDDSGYTILYRDGPEDDFEDIASYEDGSTGFLKPFGVSPDGRNLIVMAYHNGETIGLFEFDPRSKTYVSEIFRRSDADIADVFVDPITRDVLNATYEVGGDVHQYYLESSRELYAPQLGPDDPPIGELQIVSSTADRQTFIYWRTGPTEPGAHYLRSAPTNESVLVGQRAANIDRAKLATAEAFVVKSKDGTQVEAFLTRPRSPTVEPTPLIVMPHGGPIGVRDRPRYDPVVQYLASWGFAIVQANYRGSSGYGQSFLEAGKKEWAKGIEDDIDAAVEYALALPDIARDRACIIGGSYGGFSAIASVLRHPNRYRCAATINGVSDIPLVGESSDIADSDRALEAFEALAGDLETERERLLEISPAYHLRDVETPILVVYGDEDRRVDPDHAIRVAMMLRLYDKEYEEIRVAGGRHSFTRDQWLGVIPEIRKFLTTHLMPAIEYERDPR